MGIDEETQQYIDRLKSRERPKDEVTDAIRPASTMTSGIMAARATLEKKTPEAGFPIDLNVVKSNKLISSRYHLSKQEQRLFLFLLSKVFRDTDKFEQQRVPLSEFKNILPQIRGGIYTEIDKVTDKLMRQFVKILEEDGSWRKRNLFHGIDYEKNDSCVVFRFHDDLKPELLKLKNKFTVFNVLPLLYCRSVFSVRIYELLKAFVEIGSRTIDLNDLRYFLGVEDKYSEFRDFDRRVLKKAKQEVSKYTDIQFGYELIRQKRQVKAVKFKITKKPVQLKLLQMSGGDNQPGKA